MSRGLIAAGHAETARAAATMLEAGGNAFDAALAGLCAACVAEPVLNSLGGGGFLLARPATGPREGQAVLYDFFTQTPRVRRPDSETDLYPILADFGPATQEFHIGFGALAVPGTVRGLFRAHRDLGRMPMAEIVEPARALARAGVPMNRLQAFILSVVGPICLSSPASRAVYGRQDAPDRLMAAGEAPRLAALADTFDALAHEGEDLFYRGEMTAPMLEDCLAGGGHLTRADLEAYAVIPRRPLAFEALGAHLMTNPPPSTGGLLIAFALELLDRPDLPSLDPGSAAYLTRLVRAMDLTNRARVESGLRDASAEEAAERLLDPAFVALYRDRVMAAPQARRGTTHISVIDAQGNAAALSLSNGEGSGYLIPGTGIMMNNMLGEEDINPHGFNRWPPDRRMGSMMAPTLAMGADGAITVLGSGGSNRIRTAILQVLLNTLAFGDPLDVAVARPRVHFEDGRLNVEDGPPDPAAEGLDFRPEVLAGLGDLADDLHPWGGPNMFFGGVHAVRRHSDGRLEGGGDPRRGGVVVTV
ncbi:MAG: gamma-glutamyltransferase [Rhodobacterales bacterium]|nr:gamma-glutamyltransferase [Rhodobacterales bacterium]